MPTEEMFYDVVPFFVCGLIVIALYLMYRIWMEGIVESRRDIEKGKDYMKWL
jgi:hypothetical protein